MSGDAERRLAPNRERELLRAAVGLERDGSRGLAPGPQHQRRATSRVDPGHVPADDQDRRVVPDGLQSGEDPDQRAAASLEASWTSRTLGGSATTAPGAVTTTTSSATARTASIVRHSSGTAVDRFDELVAPEA